VEEKKRRVRIIGICVCGERKMMFVEEKGEG
jgi:hypothetical protein